MKTLQRLTFFVAAALVISSCQSSKLKVTPIQNGAELTSKNLNLKVQFYNANIARVTKWPKEGSAEKHSLSVLVKELPQLNIQVQQSDSVVLLSSENLTVKVNLTSGIIQYLKPDGTNILLETGTPTFEPVAYDGDKGYAVTQQFTVSEWEGIYGFGQNQDGIFNYRGREVKLVQSNTDAVNPFLISTNQYGILWDNYSKTVFAEKNRTASLYADMVSNIDYYFVHGANMDSVISGYRYLTGPAPMFGKHAYGYWQSKEHYDTQEELMTVARKYRALKIPIDNMIQDWDYWNGAANWSGMFFDKTLFPEPEKMCQELHDMNYRIIISIWPALGPKTEIYADMEKNGFLYKPVGWAGFKYYDAFNPAANALYWKYLKNGLYSKGLDGWWIDSTEPDVVNALTKESSEYELKKMGSTHIGSWARYLNAFSLVMTDDVYKNWRNETADRRLFILTRSTYAGQQRNAATTWSGDIGANWQVFSNQLTAGLNHCMSGIPYWTFDIGAFVLGAYDGVFCNGGKDPAYQELYNRMFQYGAFAPIFRSHGSETPREIWEMGEFTPALIKFDNLRYRLMPYIYSQAWKVTSQNYTYMRGLPMDFTNDRTTYSIYDQFMFGPSIMACPVLEYMYHTPPQPTVLVDAANFKTNSGEAGLEAKYYKDIEYKVLGKEQIDSSINVFWYTGRPDYVTDSMFSIRWEGKLIPTESGKHQFHMKSFDKKRIILNGDTLKIAYTSTEQYTVPVELEAGKEYSFVVETENTSTGAARMQLFWKTPSIFAVEANKSEKPKTKEVYLPAGTNWVDFWTGKVYNGGDLQTFDAPKDMMPILIKAGSIIPMGPFVEYTTQKPADPIELRVYAGADAAFTLYEDENDNYNYEKGIYSTIQFNWNDATNELTVDDRKGEFPGMLKTRTFNVVLVAPGVGNGIETSKKVNATIKYNGQKQTVKL